MITKQQYQILNACADDWEVFYFPFAMVNFGGQVFRRCDGPSCTQYDDERTWPVTVVATDIARDIVTLIRAGLITCQRVGDDGSREALGGDHLDEFSVYRGYECLTFSDHVERHGYGPHEFKVTDQGVAERACGKLSGKLSGLGSFRPVE